MWACPFEGDIYFPTPLLFFFAVVKYYIDTTINNNNNHLRKTAVDQVKLYFQNSTIALNKIIV